MHAGAAPQGVAGGDILVATEFADDAAVVRGLLLCVDAADAEALAAALVEAGLAAAVIGELLGPAPDPVGTIALG